MILTCADYWNFSIIYKLVCHSVAVFVRVQKKTVLKEPNPLFFAFYWVLGFIGFSDFFYSNEQLGSLLADLAHQLSFHLDLPAL